MIASGPPGTVAKGSSETFTAVGSNGAEEDAGVSVGAPDVAADGRPEATELGPAGVGLGVADEQATATEATTAARAASARPRGSTIAAL